MSGRMLNLYVTLVVSHPLRIDSYCFAIIDDADEEAVRFMAAAVAKNMVRGGIAQGAHATFALHGLQLSSEFAGLVVQPYAADTAVSPEQAETIVRRYLERLIPEIMQLRAQAPGNTERCAAVTVH